MSDLIVLILKIVLIIAGATFAFRFVWKRINKDSTKTVQKNNVVFGDQAGRDIQKKTERR